MKGGAWLAVQGLDGTEAYTRGGALEVAADGTLKTSSGLDRARRRRSDPGTCRGAAEHCPRRHRQRHRRERPQHRVGRLKLVTPEAPLTRGTDGLFRGAEGDLAADPAARVQDGALESSNVSAVETMVAMISAARQFEAQMKMLTTAENNEKTAAQLLSLS
jgi:flagellar basal-body rod protein FlgF